ncbi:hypothetical protein [Alteromonas sp. CYL-A6]|uniref:hypothetical protein n=1 Tax=Alteromonas nitratireducens TaxID=3390813 RepID=UPI0034BA320F
MMKSQRLITALCVLTTAATVQAASTQDFLDAHAVKRTLSGDWITVKGSRKIDKSRIMTQAELTDCLTMGFKIDAVNTRVRADKQALSKQQGNLSSWQRDQAGQLDREARRLEQERADIARLREQAEAQQQQVDALKRSLDRNSSVQVKQYNQAVDAYNQSQTSLQKRITAFNKANQAYQQQRASFTRSQQQKTQSYNADLDASKQSAREDFAQAKALETAFGRQCKSRFFNIADEAGAVAEARQRAQ